MKITPALGYDWLTRFYDPVVALTIREKRFKRRLVAEASIAEGDRVLDLGCGTGTLTIALHQRQPGARVLGLDADPAVLEIARSKASGAGANVGFLQGLSVALPFEDDHFDAAFSSLLFHHLTTEDKLRTFREVHRVLKPGSEFLIADWGKASGIAMRLAFFGVQLLDGFATTRDNVRGLLPAFLSEAGFQDVETTTQYSTIFGTLALYKARKP